MRFTILMAAVGGVAGSVAAAQGVSPALSVVIGIFVAPVAHLFDALFIVINRNNDETNTEN